MNTYANKIRISKGQAIASGLSNQQSGGHLEDNRPEAIAQRKLQRTASHSPYVQQLRAIQHTLQTRQATQLNGYLAKGQLPVQKKGGNTGLPDQLKSGIENLSGHSLGDVRLQRKASVRGVKALASVSQLKGGKLLRGTLPPMPGKAPLQAYWAAKKSFGDGRELRYWQPVAEDGKGYRREGWYTRAYDGSWGDSSQFVNSDPLVFDAPGVKRLSRLAYPSAAENKLTVVEERKDFAVEGRARSGRALRGMPADMQRQRFGEIAAWCIAVDGLIGLFERNEKDVAKWRNRLAALSGAQIALGLVAGGILISGIVLTGGLAAIPMAAGAIAIGVSSAAAGVGVGAARAVAEHGLSNAQQEHGRQSGKAVVGGLEIAKGGGAVGAKEGLTRGLMIAAEAGAAEAVGATAGGGGAVLSVVKGGMGAHKAYKVNVHEIYNQVNWGELLSTVERLKKLVDRNSAGFDGVMTAQVKMKLEKTGEKISNIAKTKSLKAW
ncbi:hypothetical protein [Spirosoma sp.]|uniref:hypothetical protein n=1 Tax=Spirosoma sp. TaxID=1899569 RepID=UPI00261D5EEE|nr:hypothetical protein [Spirosoma sp.]MCX6219089.1 hypothetical protein [Spirosoma sp.]